MERSIVARCPHVHDAKPRQNTMIQRFLQPFIHGRNILARYRTADDGVHELITGTARQGFKLHPAVTELPATAGLLLVPTLHARRAPYGLSEGDLHLLISGVGAVP